MMPKTIDVTLQLCGGVSKLISAVDGIANKLSFDTGDEEILASGADRICISSFQVYYNKVKDVASLLNGKPVRFLVYERVSG